MLFKPATLNGWRSTRLSTIQMSCCRILITMASSIRSFKRGCSWHALQGSISRCNSTSAEIKAEQLIEACTGEWDGAIGPWPKWPDIVHQSCSRRILFHLHHSMDPLFIQLLGMQEMAISTRQTQPWNNLYANARWGEIRLPEDQSRSDRAVESSST